MEYLKPFFLQKFIFDQIWAKRAQIHAKKKLFFFWFFEKFIKNLFKVFLGNNLKWNLVLLLLFHDQSHIASSFVLRYYHFKCVWPGISKLPKITSLLFPCNVLKQPWVMKLIFYMQASMKAFYKLILWF